MGGKTTQPKGEPAAGTMLSPAAPAYGAAPTSTSSAEPISGSSSVAGSAPHGSAAPDANAPASSAEGSPSEGSSSEGSPSEGSPAESSRVSERVLAVDASDPARCLLRAEVTGYLAKRCPAELRARVNAHVAGCSACAQRVRHLDDEILEYMGGQRSEAELALMDAHLDVCRACRDLMHHVVQGMAQTWQGEERGAADSTTTFASGSIVNSRYHIRGFLGRGGMGEVYEAFDQLMDRRVALKTVLCNVADRPRASRRFKEEVRNAQRVAHAHVCRINELQEHRDVFGLPLPFFTMEFIDGERLGYRIQLGTLALVDVKTIAHQLLAGLEAAHERGVLHLDFKSDNVMLRLNTPEPDAVIMDFGLSRVLGKESRLRTSERRQFAGTLTYMSVEQLECRDDVGPATDVYSFGVVLYEMLTRKLPFAGDSLSAALLKQLKERPKPPSHHVRGLAPALDRFVLRCLSADPAARFDDAGQALAALKQIGPWSRRHRSQQTLKLLPLAGVAVLGFAASSFFGERTPLSSDADVAAVAPVAPGVEQRRQELAPEPDTATTAAAERAAAEAAVHDRAAVKIPIRMPPALSAATAMPATAPRSAPPRSAQPLPREAREPSSTTGTVAAPKGDLPSTAPAPASGETPPPAEPSWKPARVPRRLRSDSMPP